MHDTNVLAQEYEVKVDQFITDHINIESRHPASHYITLLNNKLAKFDTTGKKWRYMRLLREHLYNFHQTKHGAEIVDAALSNSYACFFASGRIFSSLMPYLERNKPGDGDEFKGIDIAIMQDRLDQVKSYLKKEYIRDQDLFEEIDDLVSHASYGKRRFAQLVLGAMASLVLDGTLNEDQAATISSIIIVGLPEPKQHVLQIVNFNNTSME